VTGDRQVLTADALRATPEGTLRIDDAEVLAVDGADEGTGTGFDALDPSAFAEIVLRSPRTWLAVTAWYEERLTELGWSLGSQADAGPQLYAYRQFLRGSREEYWVRQLYPDARSHAPTGAFERPGTVLSTLYKVRPGPPDVAASRPLGAGVPDDG